MAERQVAAVLMAAGAKDVTLPTVQGARDRFDAALVDDGKATSDADPERAELMRALGLI